MAGLRGLARAGKAPENDTRSIRDYLEQFAAIPLLNSSPVSAVIPAGIQYAIAPHGLGFAYTGGVLTSISFPTGAVVQTPEAASIAGIDIRKNVLLYLTAVAGFDVTVNFLVY